MPSRFLFAPATKHLRRLSGHMVSSVGAATLSPAHRSSVEALEMRIAPATLDLTGSVLTFTLDDGATAASFSESSGNLTFDAGTGHTITLTGDAALNGFGTGAQTATGSSSTLSAITQINVIGGNGLEAFAIQTLSGAIPGLDIDGTVEALTISSPSLHSTGTLSIRADVTLAGAYTLQADDDIVIAASVSTTGATGDLTLVADGDNDGVGGVYVATEGSVSAGRDLTLIGSGLSGFAGEAIRIDADGPVSAPSVQAQAVRDIVIATSSLAGANAIGLGGYVTNTNTGLTLGNIRFAGPVDVIDSAASVYAKKTGSITFEKTLESGNHHDLTLRSDLGNINFQDAVGTIGTLGAIEITNATDVNASGSITAARLLIDNALATVTFSAAVTTTEPATVSHFVHAAALVTGAVEATNAGSIVWQVDSIDLTGDIAGTGGLTLSPISVAGSIGINGAGSLNLSALELMHLQDGFDQITIGRADGTGTITSSGAIFRDAIEILTPGGSLYVDGTLAGLDANASITLKAKNIRLGVDWGPDLAPDTPAISTAGADVTITGRISLTADTLIGSNSGASGGDVTITATINGAFGLKIDALDGIAGGAVIFNGLPNPPGDASIGGGTRPSSLTVDARSISLTPHTFTTGTQTYNADQSITTHGGALSSTLGDVILNGPVVATMNLRINAAGDIRFAGTVDNDTPGSLGALTLSAGNGVWFQGSVGTTNKLASTAITRAAMVSVAQEFHIAGAIGVIAAQIDLGAPGTVSGGSFTLQPATDLQNVRIGDAIEPGSIALEFGADDVLALADGFNSIWIGRQRGVGTLSVAGGVIFHDPLALRGYSLAVDGDITTDGDGSVTLLGSFTNLNANLSSSGTGSITLNAVNLMKDIQISTNSGNVLFTKPVLSAGGYDLNVVATSGSVKFAQAIGNGKLASRPGMIDVESGGVTTLNRVDAQALTVSGTGTTLLRNKVVAWGTTGIDIATDVQLGGNATLVAYNAGIIVAGDVQSPIKAYGFALSTTNGDINLLGGIGTVDPVSTLSATTSLDGGAAIHINGAVSANKISLKGANLTTSNLISTTAAQTYTAANSISLNALNGGSALAVTSGGDIVNAGPWSFAGRAALKSTSVSASSAITISGDGNGFGEILLTGRNATIRVDGDLKIAGGKISRVGTLAGLTTLTSVAGDIQQTGGFETWRLVADASAGAITFDTGTLRVAELGTIHAAGDITIVRGGPRNLFLKGQISSDSGKVVIVADSGGSSGNIDNDYGASVITATRFLLFGFDESASVPLLGGLEVPTYPFYLRYSADPLNPGNPDNIPGSQVIYARK